MYFKLNGCDSLSRGWMQIYGHHYVDSSVVGAEAKFHRQGAFLLLVCCRLPQGARLPSETQSDQENHINIGGLPNPSILVQEAGTALGAKQGDDDDTNKSRKNANNPLVLITCLLRPGHLARLFKWPVICGGGAASNSSLLMSTPMLQQMLVAEMLLLEARAEDDDAKTKGKALPDLEERPFDWWSPGLVGVSGLLFRVMLLARASIRQM